MSTGSSRGVSPGRHPAVRVRPGGPLVVDDAAVPLCRCPADGGPESALPGVGPTGSPRRPRANLALCRCGRSATRPHCDGSHRDHQPAGPDVAVAAPVRVELPGPARRPTPARVVVVDGGPLVVHGWAVHLPDGEVLPGDGPAVLCRCGATTCWPHCDGASCPARRPHG